MEPADVAPADIGSTAERIIGAWLGELDACLPAGRRARRDIRREISDGLRCAVDERMERGQSAERAARAAVTEFGDPRAVASAFAGQLGTTSAHQLGVGLVLSGPFIGLTWVAAYATAGPGWLSRIGSVLSAMPQYLPILAVTVPASILAIAGSGWAARHVAIPASMATAAALIASIGCVVGDLSLLSATILGHGSIAGPPIMAPIAIAASTVRLSAAGWAGQRIARLRAAAN